MLLFSMMSQSRPLLTYILGGFFGRWESGASLGITGNHGEILWDVHWPEIDFFTCHDGYT